MSRVIRASSRVWLSWSGRHPAHRRWPHGAWSDDCSIHLACRVPCSACVRGLGGDIGGVWATVVDSASGCAGRARVIRKLQPAPEDRERQHDAGHAASRAIARGKRNGTQIGQASRWRGPDAGRAAFRARRAARDFAPKSVAVIGATKRRAGSAHRAVEPDQQPVWRHGLPVNSGTGRCWGSRPM